MTTKERDLCRFADKNSVGSVDKEKGIVHGVSLLTANREASGHGVFIDETMLRQAFEFAKEKEPVGLKSRFEHPNACGRALGTFVGRFHNFRIDAEQLRGDLHLAEVAAKSPEGDLRLYILELAVEDPEAFATSIVFRPAESEKPLIGPEVPEDDPVRLPHVRIESLHHCDVVDEGAGNDGLFGRPDYMAEQAERWALDNMPIWDKISKRYEAWKNGTKTKERKQEMEELQKQVDALTSELATAQEKISEFETGAEGKRKEAFDEGVTQGVEQAQGAVAARVEKYGDSAFVLETIAMSDGEAKDKWIEKLEADNKELAEKKTVSTALEEGGEAVEMAAGDALKTGASKDTKEAYSARVEELKTAGKTAMQAHKQARKEFKRK